MHMPWNGTKAQHFKNELASGWGLFAGSLPQTEDELSPETPTMAAQLSRLRRLTQGLDAAAS